ncbi:MAG: inositol monophosphatase family protein [Azospirillaceae bacterium]
MVDHERVAALLQAVAASEIMPRFRRLARHDVTEKAPGDVVTVADTAAERELAAGLLAMLPGSVVVGEEAAASDPGILGLLTGEAPVWVIDPIDGTRNFAAGRTPFVSMVALVERGRTIGGWIVDPVAKRTAIAVVARGAFLDAAALCLAPAAQSVSAWRGRFNPGKSGPRRRRSEAIRDRIGRHDLLTSAGATYVEVARGEIDFAIFQNQLLKPWDHLAGALLVTEAGGVAKAPGSGDPYASTLEAGPLLVARSPTVWQEIADIYNQIMD